MLEYIGQSKFAKLRVRTVDTYPNLTAVERFILCSKENHLNLPIEALNIMREEEKKKWD
jgi:hypothetical protein